MSTTTQVLTHPHHQSVKAGYMYGPNDTLIPHPNCNWIRGVLGCNRPSPDDDPITGPLGDVAMASIVRFVLLKHLLRSDCMALASLAAGIIGATRTLSHSFTYANSLGFHMGHSTYESWPSAIIKCAGAHMHRMFLISQRANKGIGNGLLRSMTDRMYTFVWNCIPHCLASTLSDDSGLRRDHVTELREDGVLVRPSPSAWKSLCEVLSLLTPNSFSGVPKCRLAYRQSNGKWGEQPLAPARTLAMLQYACSVLPSAARQIISHDSVKADMATEYARMQQERERFAMWACGNSSDITAQMHCFDLAVSCLYDKMQGCTDRDRVFSWHRQLYACWKHHEHDNSLPFVMTPDGAVTMQVPPWAQTSAPEITEIVGRRVGIFEPS